MKWFEIKFYWRKVINNLKGISDPYCQGCHNPKHHRPLTMGFIGAYIGTVTGLGIMESILNE